MNFCEKISAKGEFSAHDAAPWQFLINVIYTHCIRQRRLRKQLQDQPLLGNWCQLPEMGALHNRGTAFSALADWLNREERCCLYDSCRRVTRGKCYWTEFRESALELRRQIRSGKNLVEKVVVVLGLAQICCGWSTEIFREPRGNLISAVGNSYQTTGEDKVDWEHVVHAIENCRLCIAMKCYY
jgi:hypothetical protein